MQLPDGRRVLVVKGGSTNAGRTTGACTKVGKGNVVGKAKGGKGGGVNEINAILGQGGPMAEELL